MLERSLGFPWDGLQQQQRWMPWVSQWLNVMNPLIRKGITEGLAHVALWAEAGG